MSDVWSRERVMVVVGRAGLGWEPTTNIRHKVARLSGGCYVGVMSVPCLPGYQTGSQAYLKDPESYTCL